MQERLACLRNIALETCEHRRHMFATILVEQVWLQRCTRSCLPFGAHRLFACVGGRLSFGAVLASPRRCHGRR